MITIPVPTWIFLWTANAAKLLAVCGYVVVVGGLRIATIVLLFKKLTVFFRDKILAKL